MVVVRTNASTHQAATGVPVEVVSHLGAMDMNVKTPMNVKITHVVVLAVSIPMEDTTVFLALLDNKVQQH